MTPRTRVAPEPDRHGWLLHDGDCGFCAAAAAWLVRRGMGAGSRPLQTAEVAWALDRERARREVPFRHPDGRISWGDRAIADALATCPGPLRFAGLLLATPAGHLVGAPVYRLVAGNRHRLPGGTGSCSMRG